MITRSVTSLDNDHGNHRLSNGSPRESHPEVTITRSATSLGSDHRGITALGEDHHGCRREGHLLATTVSESHPYDISPSYQAPETITWLHKLLYQVLPLLKRRIDAILTSLVLYTVQYCINVLFCIFT